VGQRFDQLEQCAGILGVGAADGDRVHSDDTRINTEARRHGG
jgi:hypothetical protein